MPDHQESTYVAVTNIPNDFHVADLRAHFSTFVENGSFTCFHYRHRPEKISQEEETEQTLKPKTKSNSRFCCVVAKIRKSRFKEFEQRYNNEQWTDASSNYSTHTCGVSMIRITRESSESDSSSDCIQEERLLSMPELKPPDLMPNGNVGTPTYVFLDLIQRCLLPDRLINTLKLKFPKTEGKRLYSNVNYDYPHNKKDFCVNINRKTYSKTGSRLDKSIEKNASEPGSDFTNEKCESDDNNSNADISGIASDDRTKICSEINVNSASATTSDKSCNQNALTKRELKRLKTMERKETLHLMNENIEEHLIGIEKKYHNDEDAEEWDRHEATEDDPSNQERNKERLYEEEIEQPWEKGGPGVVFYTDAMFWQAREGDFDEQTTDDLDVDFSPYEGDGPGDKDIRDFLKIRQERRFRSGYDKTDRFSIGLSKRPVPDDRPTSFRSLPLPGPSVFKKPMNETIGQFEIHTKGVGRKILEKQGWADGQGLGKGHSGIKQALKGEGQGPRRKKGLGFVRPEPVRYGTSSVKKAKGKRSEGHFITTSLDSPHETDPKEKLLERQESTTLKHRKSFTNQSPVGS